jgi:Domain of unknown function (DUF4340)
MTPRSLLILIVLAVVALGGGWYFGAGTVPAEQKTVDAGTLMFPGLAPKLAKATKIEVVFQGKTTVIELKDGVWGIADRGGYPVQDSKLHAMLTALTELRLIEPRTSDPAAFSRLGVEDPSKPEANSNLLRVLDADGKPIVAVITGHRRTRTQGRLEQEVYVRRPDENQSWLAQGALEVDHDPNQWLNRDVSNIAHTRIASVTATRGDSKLVFTRDGDKLVLSEPKDHPKLEDFKLEDISRAFEALTFQEVRPASQPIGTAEGTSVFTTTDGLTLTATVFKADKDIWVALTASGDEKAKAEADALNKKLNGWLYQLGAWKETALVPTMDDLKAAEPPPAAPPPDAPPPEAPPPAAPPPPAPPAK